MSDFIHEPLLIFILLDLQHLMMVHRHITAELTALHPASRSKIVTSRGIKPKPIVAVASGQPFPLPCRAFCASSTARLGHSYNDDSTIPDFYARRKQLRSQKEALSASQTLSRAENDSESLMGQLFEPSPNGFRSRHLVSKVPRQLLDAEGRLVHPYGFVTSTPTAPPRPRDHGELEKDKAQQTAAVAERVLENDFSSNFAAEIHPRKGKVPFEATGKDGTVYHPSGFTPPTSAHGFWQLVPSSSTKPILSQHSRALSSSSQAQTPSPGSNPTTTETDNVAHGAKEQTASSSPTPSGTATSPNPRSTETDPIPTSKTDAETRQEQRQAIQERKEEEGGLMSELTAGLLSGGVSASTEPRNEKVPPELTFVHHGSVPQPIQHPSGFVPPKPGSTRGIHTTTLRTRLNE